MRSLRLGLEEKKSANNAANLLAKSSADFNELATKVNQEYYLNSDYDRQDIFRRVAQKHPAVARSFNMEFKLVLANLKEIGDSPNVKTNEKEKLSNAVKVWLKSLERLNPPVLRK